MPDFLHKTPAMKSMGLKEDGITLYCTNIKSIHFGHCSVMLTCACVGLFLGLHFKGNEALFENVTWKFALNL